MAGVDALPIRNTYRVAVTRGPDAGLEAAFDGGEFTIGTHPSNSLVLTDPTVSSFHCRLTGAGDKVRLVDDSSTNGTFVAGVRVREVFPDDGTAFSIGETEIGVGVTRDVDPKAHQPGSFGEAVGASAAMRSVFERAQKAAINDLPVLILGETGVGKDVLARSIHRNSRRADAPLVIFNCGSASPTLIESELFGHERGAFTSADRRREGVFERANGGTLFINEIGELPIDMQPKLLDVFDRGAVTRLGSGQEVPVDVRFIAATNRNLRRMVDDKTFRADLYYRLAVTTVHVPPLRERPDDIPVLALHFLEQAFEHQEQRISPRLKRTFEEGLEDLKTRRWSGNIRELRNVVERAAANLDPRLLDATESAQLDKVAKTISRMVADDFLPLEQAREQFDRQYLRDLFDAHQGNLKEAAEVAGVHPNSLTRLLRRYGMQRKKDAPDS